jgi:hypothetical protein
MSQTVRDRCIAILAEQDRPIHYAVLTGLVLASRESSLGERGSTPAQTVGTILRTTSRICKPFRGYYCLREKKVTITKSVDSDKCAEFCREVTALLCAVNPGERECGVSLQITHERSSPQKRIVIVATLDAVRWYRVTSEQLRQLFRDMKLDADIDPKQEAA